jgi:urease beta subunit
MYSFPNLTGNTLENNAANGLCLLNINGDLDVDATWDITDTSYYLRDDVIQAAGKTLTIASGVVVKFGSGLSLIVNGTLTVQGIESAPVYFTSYRDDSVGGDTNGDGVSSGARGDWRRIEFTSYSSPSSLVDYAVIRFGGRDDYYHSNDRGGIALAGASPTIQNTTIIDNAYCAITADMYSFPNLTGNTLENNAANGLCLLNINGDLDVDATWDITDTSYYLRDDVIQAAGKTLTIASGVVVKFGSGLSLIVNGTLTVQGIESAPVYFTSYRDDSVGGDTNGDGVSSGARGDWRRIEFTSYSSPSSLVDYAVIRFGGRDDYYHSNDRGGDSVSRRFSNHPEHHYYR